MRLRCCKITYSVTLITSCEQCKLCKNIFSKNTRYYIVNMASYTRIAPFKIFYKRVVGT